MKEQEIKPKPVRVLHVLGTTNLGGAESRIMELYRCIDRGQVQFDFLIHTKEDGHYSEEIRSLGGHIYSLPRFKFFNIAEYRKAIRTFFKEHKEFTVIQGHMTSTAAIYSQAGICQTVTAFDYSCPCQKCRRRQRIKRYCYQGIAYSTKK